VPAVLQQEAERSAQAVRAGDQSAPDLTMAGPAAGGEITDLPRAYRGLRLEVEVFGRAQAWETGESHAGLYVPGVALTDLTFGQEQHRFAHRPLPLASFGEQAVELIVDRRVPQLGEQLLLTGKGRALLRSRAR